MGSGVARNKNAAKDAAATDAIQRLHDQNFYIGITGSQATGDLGVQQL